MRLNILAPLIIFLSFLVSASASKADEPREFVQQLSNNVVGVLKDPSSQKSEKLSQLKNLLDQNADLELLAKLILGRHWRSASKDEQTEYVSIFRKLVNKTMADRLSDYGGETIEVVGSQALNDRDTMVKTLVHRPNGSPPYKVDWRVRQNEDRTAVIDVIAEGVSLVVTQRSEIGSIVTREGMSGLIETLQARLDNN